MNSFVKICGLRDAAMVEVALDAGADALGLVFARSPRAVSVPLALQLVDLIRSSALVVAVMRHPAQPFAVEVLERVRPDWLQTDAQDFDNIAMPASVTALPVYRDTESLDEASLPERVLFEGGDSGTGQTADWSLAARIATQRELVLAGGLSPDNVFEAIQAVRPAGVDVSSGVESRRGEKDAGAIRAFVEAARAGFAAIH